MAVHVLCVRHGLSTWNLARRWQGTADPPLSDEGRAGAAELAAALSSTIGHGPRVRIWSSNLQRAHETATIIAARLGCGPVTVDPRLVEADVGEWEGLTVADIEADWPGYLAAGRRPPGFEPEADLLARVVPALEDIAGTATAAGVVPIVVAHAGVLRAVRRHSGAGDEHLANLGGLWFAIEPGTVRFSGLFEPSRHVVEADDGRL
ncbi:MAG TPA: histidine phosphatase family protein [Ilumatobacteraceae bacterium]|nr:histidine phosphatase family protein [Ilumatobacteraceae bacterium]